MSYLSGYVLELQEEIEELKIKLAAYEELGSIVDLKKLINLKHNKEPIISGKDIKEQYDKYGCANCINRYQSDICYSCKKTIYHLKFKLDDMFKKDEEK